MALTRRAIAFWLPLLLVASLIDQVKCQQDWPSSTTGIAVLTCVGVVTAGLSAGIIYAICKEMGHCNESKVAPLKVTKEVKKTPANKQKAAEEQATKKPNEPRMEQQTTRSELRQPDQTQEAPSSNKTPPQNAPNSKGSTVNPNSKIGQQYGGYDDRGNVVGNIII